MQAFLGAIVRFAGGISQLIDHARRHVLHAHRQLPPAGHQCRGVSDGHGWHSVKAGYRGFL